jgi:hypothetical protein
VVRIVRAEIVEQQEGIVFFGQSEADRAVQMNAGALESGAAFDHFPDLPLRCHEALLSD